MGKLFFSETYKRMLSSNEVRERKQLSILSNATLFTKDNFERYLQGKENIEVELSIDGARKETIQRLRRGAVYEKIYENFKYLGELRKAGEIAMLSVNYVVQAENVYEIPEMIAWCGENAVD